MYYNPAMASRHLSVRFFLPILFIGLLFCATALAGKKNPPAQPININTANLEELQLVPGVGPVTAGKILQMRKSYGVQERGRFAGDSRIRGEAPRQNAQVFDGRKIRGETHAASGAVCNEAAPCRRAAVVGTKRRSRFLAPQTLPERKTRTAPGMTNGRGRSARFHRVWGVGLGWSMRRGTWSAMRMP